MSDGVYADRYYKGEVELSDEKVTCMAIVIDACRSVGASRLPFAISDDELRAASAGLQSLAEDLGYGK